MVKIIASSIEDFNKVQSKLGDIEPQVQSLIATAEIDGLLGFRVTYMTDSWTSKGVYLPHGIRQITHFDDYIACYGNDIFIKIPATKDQRFFTFIIL